MKKTKRKVTVLLVVAMIAGLFWGCSSLPDIDASKYVQAVLDAKYKNDATLLEELGAATKEEVEQMHNGAINDTVNAMFAAGGISGNDELKQRYRDIYNDILSRMDYTVKDAQKLSDGTYNVTVTYRKMNLFVPAMKKVRKNLNKVSTASVQSAVDSIFTLLADNLEKTLSKDTEYGIEEVMIVHLVIDDNKYVIKQEDAEALTMNLLDAEEGIKVLQ